MSPSVHFEIQSEDEKNEPLRTYNMKPAHRSDVSYCPSIISVTLGDSHIKRSRRRVCIFLELESIEELQIPTLMDGMFILKPS